MLLVVCEDMFCALFNSSLRRCGYPVVSYMFVAFLKVCHYYYLISNWSAGGGLKRAAEPEAATHEEKRFHLDAVVTSDGTPEVVRRKRRKYALLLSYCGKGYLGMQR